MYSSSDMAKHTKDIHQGRRYKCRLCDYKSKAAEGMTAHLMLKHDIEIEGKEVFRCSYPQCRFKAPNMTKVKDHINSVHLKLYEFGCEVCGKMFKWKGGLQLHLKVSHGQGVSNRRHKCEKCDLSFKFSHQVREHFEKEHRDNLKPEHLCPKCGKEFLREGGLAQHIRLSHGPKIHVPCPHCPPKKKKKLYTKQSLYSHISAIHKRKFRCPRCGNNYASKAMMVIHYRVTHLKYKQFKCRECNTKFAKRCYATKHILQKHYERMPGEEEPSNDVLAMHPVFEDLKFTEPAGCPSTQDILDMLEKDAQKFNLGPSEDETKVFNMSAADTIIPPQTET